ncbi:MAG: PSD1 domain-containing protein [Planctomycetales bacterium]|nr:PSD1 domain-containing protein [Planctomycetales bacterium]
MLAVIMFSVDVSPALASESDEQIEFNRDIRPILSNHCFACHGPDKGHREAGLRLDDEASATAELESGFRAIVPGKPSASHLLDRLTATDASAWERMPPNESALDAKQIGLIRRWIEQGAKWQPHWSLIPPVRPQVPQAVDSQWARNEIDCFLQSRWQRQRLRPSPEADRITLVRRLYFDLLGLPPRPEDVQRFLDDRSPQAYESLVDRLLDSPHYGERMAMFWLDLVRYADTVGYHGDQDHNISPYRDYVIRAFNENLPFDQFTIEQLAGDLLPDPTVWQRVATGYNRLLQTTHEGGAQDKEYLAKYAADRVRTTASVWLGITLGCCECHDHKFDPYTTEDFYRFAAFFADVKEQGAYNAPNSIPTRRLPEMLFFETEEDRQQYGQLEQEIANLSAQKAPEATENQTNSAAHTAERLEQLKQELSTVAAKGRWTMVTESVTPRTMRVLPRGDWLDETGPVVTPAVPAVYGELVQESADSPVTRLDLARWLVDPAHPQTAWVLVNRLWRQFYGVGISKVLDDVGAQGEWPVHPELLDWLAVEFTDSGWDVKHIIRLMLTSSAYRQASVETAELRGLDPDNRWIARQSRFRLPAEVIRDTSLSVSGLMATTIGGRSVRPYQPEGYYAHLNFPEREYRADRGENLYRRGVYTHWQRQFLHPALKAFDAPSREECVAERPISNTPLAALTLLNDPCFVEAARVFAQQIVERGGADDRQRLQWAYAMQLSRMPSEEEEQVLLALLAKHRREYEADIGSARQVAAVGEATGPPDERMGDVAAWTSVARTLMNLNESITRN